MQIHEWYRQARETQQAVTKEEKADINKLLNMIQAIEPTKLTEDDREIVKMVWEWELEASFQTDFATASV